MSLRRCTRPLKPELRRRRLCLATLVACVADASAAVPAEPQPVLRSVDLPGTHLELQFEDGFSEALLAEAQTWVQRSAGAVASYFGRFPVAGAEILLQPVEGSGVRSGFTTLAGQTLLVRVRLGAQATREQLYDDWIMVHEMIHLAIPRVQRSQNWLHEGLATYVESVARSQAGLVPPAEVWREWTRQMGKGQPQAGDRGLDRTPTWGRTYWGGALFCLQADVGIRQRSDSRLGLQHALRGVLAEGGSYGVAWPVRRILAAGDRAVGQTTLTELYEQMRESAEPVDLEALWHSLGVDGAVLRDDAPLAAVRRAILS